MTDTKKSLADYQTEDKIRDVSKGRYSVKKVQAIFAELYKDGFLYGFKTGERSASEYMCLLIAQTLFYDENYAWTNKQLDELFSRISPALSAFDAGTYNPEEIRQALSEDANWKFKMEWPDD